MVSTDSVDDIGDRTVSLETTLTESEVRKEAFQGRYYSYEKHQWQSMSMGERAIRRFVEIVTGLFKLHIIDSSEVACLRLSWKAIEKMSTLPERIRGQIENLLLDSLYPTNLLSVCSGIISRLYCRVHQEDAKAKGVTVNQLYVQQSPYRRYFIVSDNNELLYLVTNSQYGRLDFYNPQSIKVSTNDYDSLKDDQDNRIGGIKLAVDYHSLPSSMVLYSGQDLPLVKIEDNAQRVSLVFRDTITNRILAVSNLLLDSPSSIRWTMTLIDREALEQQQLTPLLLAWAVLKYSQHYYFPNPSDVGYERGVPKIPNDIRYVDAVWSVDG